MEGIVEIRWHGRGGQGVVTAGKLLADAALDAGLFFQAFPDYGPERMGAPIRAFTRLSKNPINVHSQIAYPGIVIVLDPTVMGTVNVVEGLHEDGVLLVNTSDSPGEIRERVNFHTGRVFTVDANSIAMKHFGRELTNTPMLGALARATGLFTLEALEEQIHHKFERKFGDDIVDANVSALRDASAQLQEG
jgi:pyruvate ferredoxin oxidoreductase gamma subunit